MLQEPCLQGILPSHSLFALAAKGLAFEGLQLRKLGCSCEKSFFHALKNCFFCCSMKLREARLCKNNNFHTLMFIPRCSYETQTSLALQKNIFQALKKMFFPHCSHETQKSPALQNPFFSSIFFSHASCQICQLHLVTSFKLAPNCADACNAELRMVQGV